MNILYVANVRIPTEKAHGLQIVKTCEAFADLGHSVILLVAHRRNFIKDDPFTYYAIRKNFEIRKVYSLDLIHWGRFGFLIQYATFSLCAAFSKYIRSTDFIYGRDEMALCAISFFAHAPIVWESHVAAWNIAARFVMRRVYAIVTITNGIKDYYIGKGVSAKKIFTVPDSVDLADFAHPQSRENARLRLSLPLDKKIALYIGRLDEWKGAVTLCEAATYLPDNIRVSVMGGEPQEIDEFKGRYPKVIFLGFHPYRELADNQSAADVLVLPNTAKTDISARYTSPLKLFAYMASNIPIVASDLSSIREVLDEKTAYLIQPDDPHALATGIRQALEDPHALEQAQRAREKVTTYTWKARAQHILASAVNSQPSIRQ